MEYGVKLCSGRRSHHKEKRLSLFSFLSFYLLIYYIYETRKKKELSFSKKLERIDIMCKEDLSKKVIKNAVSEAMITSTSPIAVVPGGNLCKDVSDIIKEFETGINDIMKNTLTRLKRIDNSVNLEDSEYILFSTIGNANEEFCEKIKAEYDALSFKERIIWMDDVVEKGIKVPAPSYEETLKRVLKDTKQLESELKLYLDETYATDLFEDIDEKGE